VVTPASFLRRCRGESPMKTASPHRPEPLERGEHRWMRFGAAHFAGGYDRESTGRPVAT
jgi:hypothetical protein